MKFINFGELSADQEKLLSEAEKAMENAYSPYSHFYVGVALLTLDGKRIITGTNFENASYGLTNCAERSAIFRANAEGYRMFHSLAIIARGENFETEKVTAPCGACRQVLYESSQISDHNLEIILSTTRKDKIMITSIGELLPFAFGPKDLGIEIERYQI